MKKAVAAAAASLVFLAGCSDGEPTGASGGDDSDVVPTYFNAYATRDSSDMKPMLTVAAPGSPAELYAEHQIASAVADEAANQGTEPDTVAIDGDTVTMTVGGLPEDVSEEVRREATTTFKELQFAEGGKLVTWTAEPGGPLDGRISAQQGRAKSGKVTVTAKTAYVTNNGDLTITYEVKNKGDAQAQITPKGYINPDKREVKAQGTPFNSDLSPGSFATASALITNGEPGGRLVFTLYVTGMTTPMVDLTVPISR